MWVWESVCCDCFASTFLKTISLHFCLDFNIAPFFSVFSVCYLFVIHLRNHHTIPIWLVIHNSFFFFWFCYFERMKSQSTTRYWALCSNLMTWHLSCLTVMSLSYILYYQFFIGISVLIMLSSLSNFSWCSLLVFVWNIMDLSVHC